MSDKKDADGALIARRFAKGDGPSAAPRRGLFGRWRAEPLLPEAGAGGAPLTAAIAVMSFLAALALSAFLIISDAAHVWTNDLRRELTVQIKGENAQEIAAATDAAVEVLQSTAGVLEVRALSTEETAKLLEPWLGKGNLGA